MFNVVDLSQLEMGPIVDGEGALDGEAFPTDGALERLDPRVDDRMFGPVIESVEFLHANRTLVDLLLGVGEDVALQAAGTGERLITVVTLPHLVPVVNPHV